MIVLICGYDELPTWVDKSELPNNGSGKECASYLIIEGGGNRVCYSSAMEPEDVSFWRDLDWIKDELERVGNRYYA